MFRNLAQQVNGQRGGGGFANVLQLAQEVNAETIESVKNWSDEVLILLRQIAGGVGSFDRTPFAQDNTTISGVVTLDIQSRLQRPAATGWLYNPGNTALQFSYRFAHDEKSASWTPWLTLPAEQQVSFSGVHLYEMKLRPTPGGAEAVYQIHVA